MDAALVASAALMGLAGGPHCVAMCGGVQTGIAARGGARALAALQLGRLVGYASAGALVAASVSSLASWATAAPALRPAWSLLHVAAIALGGWLLWQGRTPSWLSGATRANRPAMNAADGSQPLRFVARLSPSARAAAVGFCWTALPCGLLQSALIVAALASGPWQGAGVMAAFAIASAISLTIAPYVWRRLAAPSSEWASPTLAVRLSGALLIAGSTFALVHGLSASLDRALCALPPGMAS